jgi:hypothetical protein
MVDIKKLPLPKHDPEIMELIKTTDHKILAQWAIDCLERFLPIFEEKYPNEKIPRNAIKILKQWMNNEIKMWEARKYCWTVLKLARDIEKEDKVSCQIVRAASHCLATCHVRTHSEGVSIYVRSALQYLNKDKENTHELMEVERKWHIDHLKKLRANSKAHIENVGNQI